MKKIGLFIVFLFSFMFYNLDVLAITTNIDNELNDSSYTVLEVGASLDCQLDSCIDKMKNYEKVILSINEDYTYSSLTNYEIPSNVKSIIIKSNDSTKRTIKNIRLFANGAKLYLDESIKLSYSYIYGGSATRDITGDTYLEIHGDVIGSQYTYSMTSGIFGGGYNHDVNGNTSIVLTDEIYSVNYIYGGGHAYSDDDTVKEANVSGSTSIVIDDKIFYYPRYGSNIYLLGVYGGGRAEGLGAKTYVEDTYVESPVTVIKSSNIGATDINGLFGGGHAIEGGYAEVNNTSIYVPDYDPTDNVNAIYRDGNDIYGGGNAYNTSGVVTKSIVNKSSIVVDGWVGSGGNALEGAGPGGSASGVNSYALVNDGSIKVNESAFIANMRGIFGGGAAAEDGYSEVIKSTIDYNGKSVYYYYFGRETSGIYAGGYSNGGNATTIVREVDITIGEDATFTEFYGGGMTYDAISNVGKVTATINGTAYYGIFAGGISGEDAKEIIVDDVTFNLGNITFGKVGYDSLNYVYNIGSGGTDTDTTIKKYKFNILEGATFTLNGILEDASIASYPISLEIAGDITSSKFNINLENISEDKYATLRAIAQDEHTNNNFRNSIISVSNNSKYSTTIIPGNILGMDTNEVILYEKVTLTDQETGIILTGSKLDLDGATLEVIFDDTVDVEEFDKDLGIKYTVKVLDKDGNEINTYTVPYTLLIPTSEFNDEVIYENNTKLNNSIIDGYYVITNDSDIPQYIVAGSKEKVNIDVPNTSDGVTTSIGILVISIISILISLRYVLKLSK